MNFLLIIFTIVLIYLISRIFNLNKNKNNKLFKFKKKFLSKESSIQKIFSRDDERTSLDPNININIGLYDDEEIINRKSNIHRARLSKFKKSKLNGEMIFQDDEQRIYKFNNGKKVYL